jgi:O-antigen ligase
MFIGSITLLTDYFGITRISAVFGEHIFQEMRSGRGAGLLGGESNITAARLSSILPFSIYNLIYIKKGLNRKLFILLSVIITILAIVLTGSRMGLLVLGFICLVIGLKEIRTSKFLVKFVVIIILISTMLLINFSMNLIKDKKFEERFESIQDIPKINKIRYEEGESSIMLRYFLFFIGIDLIKKNPLLGVGIGNSKYLTVKYTQEPFQMRYLHNTYLDICSENGIIMLIILLLFLSGIVIICYSRYKKEKNEFYFYFLVAFFVQLICWFFLSDFLNKLFWSLFLPVGLFLKNYGIEK